MTWAPWVRRRLERIEKQVSAARRAAELEWQQITARRQNVVVEYRQMKRPRQWAMEAGYAAA